MNGLAKLLTAVIAVGAVAGFGAIPAGSASAAPSNIVQHPLDTGWD